ncbi:MAG TPA: hypothetical protein VK177_07835 [Flavobacteriales bacterium]|nr:hypothetical protein [Flavobacteriales bacterium]
MRILFVVFLNFFCFPIHAQDSEKKSSIEPEKKGHLFYLKTEILNSALRYLFVKPTYDLDVQLTTRLANQFHLVGTYGKTTFDLADRVESAERMGVWMYTEQKGTAYNRSSLMLRYYPFKNFDNVLDYCFVELGMHYQRYKGYTLGEIYDSTNMAYESSYRHVLDMHRYGPQLNIGISYFFEPGEGWSVGEKNKIMISPEFFIGVMYNNVTYTVNDFQDIYGTTIHEPYSEPKFKPTFRVKIGIGIF